MSKARCVGLIVAVAMTVMWVGSAMADGVDGTGLRVLTAEEMGGVAGGISDHVCVDVEEDRDDPESWEQSCTIGVTGCVGYGGNCVQKTHYRAYNECQEGTGECGQWVVTCFKGTEYERVNGQCNGGTPGPCTGEFIQSDYLFGPTITACDSEWIAL